MDTKKNYFGIILAIVIFISASAISFFALDYISEDGTQNGLHTPDETERETSDGPDPASLSLAIGASMGALAFAVWVGSRQFEKDATTMLLENGLEDMTVRDVNMVRHMMNMGEFTVPELVEKTEVSRTSVWRLVKRMVDSNLVEETEEEKLPKSGRGKPSKIYRYKGP